VFSSTTTGAASSGSNEQPTAITTMILCNTDTPNPADETDNAITVNIHLVKPTQGANSTNLIVSQLIVPAGETVFFSDERIILDGSAIYGADSVFVEVDVSNKLVFTVSSLPV
jgi:hypothetical protein